MLRFKNFIKENKIEDLYKHKLEGVKDVHADLYVQHHIDDFGRHIYDVYHSGNKIASAKLSGRR